MRKGLCRAWISACLVMAGCGGGGSGDGSAGGTGGVIYVSLIYPPEGVDLFSAKTVYPTIAGLEARNPRCTALSDNPNAGMTLNPDCSVSGRPTKAGNVTFLVRLSADNVSNTLDLGVSVRVNAPTVAYFSSSAYKASVAIGERIEVAPVLSGWSAPPGMPVSWSYSSIRGSLPPGLTLDPVTGVIAGSATSQGKYSATITATLTTPFGIHPVTSTYDVSVSVPVFSYFAWPSLGSDGYSTQAFLTQTIRLQPYDADPKLGGSTLSNFGVAPGSQLPAGLALDPQTGVITGIPTTATTTTGQMFTLTATLTNGGISIPVEGRASLRVDVPFYMQYSFSSVARAGEPLSILPVRVTKSPVPLVNPTVNYTVRTGQCQLPQGVSVDTDSGLVSGTPTAGGQYSCMLDLTSFNDGLSFVSAAQVYLVVQ